MQLQPGSTDHSVTDADQLHSAFSALPCDLSCMQATFLQYGPGTVERGYAFATFDGPGQGQVIRNPPFMPFYPQWEQVLSAVLDKLTSSFDTYVNFSNIATAGEHGNGILASSLTTF